jgi:nitrogen-specific signal transduction histidine kinase
MGFTEIPLVIVADKIQLQQVCLNLIANAIDAMAESSRQRILVLLPRRWALTDGINTVKRRQHILAETTQVVDNR